jgi:hypothetical protein
VEHVADDRTIHSLDDYFASLTPEQRKPSRTGVIRRLFAQPEG